MGQGDGKMQITRRVWTGMLLAAGLMGRVAQAQSPVVPDDRQRYPWAEKMFAELEHDFGVVARGSDTRHRIEITNLYKEEVHIGQITTTCGCTAVRPSQNVLASNQKAFIEITMDTRKFVNQKHSSVKVIFDKPLYGEVWIPIKAYIRNDVVLNPGSAEFGAVARGNLTERRLEVSYAGRADWKVREVVSKNPHLDVELRETSRANNRVKYDLLVRLKPGAPTGEFRDQLTLLTDDEGNPQIPVLVEGRIEEDFQVTADVVDFGTLTPGAKATRNVVIKGRRPFKVAQLDCEKLPGALEARLPAADKQVQIVPVSLTAPATEGTHTEVLQFRIEGETEPVNCKVFFKVAGAGNNATVGSTPAK